ncbi:hypothetical protein ANCCEY_04789 [Ancylostoma ceylanicum]|uniref:RPA-interacting protein C-terminal domain-containing protein n=2 Tax=Ancylostoma ceylanicum TaxID=53326 RepID=A0A0D6LY46_9BILA|nr:hypothetical protein ANCCEY_04789 [Ancylostoma ceylanicum]EYC43236.1 hypothetical protein Y032_0499g2565 [Ancylostoma ceylanicum]
MSAVTSNRMHLYKNTGRGPALRDALRKRCAEKIREKRMNQFDSRRDLECVVRETVNNEMKSDFSDFDQDALLELYETITKALIEEQFEDIQKIEEERLAADVEEFLNPPVYCPSCMRSPLTVDQQSATCKKCHFHHDFNNNSPPPTQSELRRLLSEGFLTHEATECGTQPRAVQHNGRLGLYCDDCGFETVII